MGKLHELLAVEVDLQGSKNRILQETEKGFREGRLFEGLQKVYEPLEEGGDKFPSENVPLTTTVAERLEYTMPFFVKAVDATVSKENTNTQAKADIILDATVVARDIPAPALLALEARLKELRAVLEVIPTLDIAKVWDKDQTRSNVFRTSPQETFKTAKLIEFLQVAAATKEHPAQIKEKTQDKRVGRWETTYFSGAITSIEKSAILARCDDLLQAVKKARQRANCQEVTELKIGKILVDHIFQS